MRILRILGWLCWRIGLRGRKTIAAILGSILYLLVPSRRNVTLTNLRRAFPTISKTEITRLARASYANLMMVLEEVLATPYLSHSELRAWFQFNNPEVLRNALLDRNGAILWSAHLANWEWSALVAALEFGQPLLVVVKEQRNRTVNRWLEQVRSSTGNVLVPMFNSARPMLKHLQSGGIVAVLGDQAADPRSDPFVPLFGIPAATHKAPVVLARQCGAALVFAYCLRKRDGRYEVFFEPLSEVHDQSLSVDQIVARYNDLLQQVILRAPEQWVWQHNRWKYH